MGGEKIMLLSMFQMCVAIVIAAFVIGLAVILLSIIGYFVAGVIAGLMISFRKNQIHKKEDNKNV